MSFFRGWYATKMSIFQRDSQRRQALVSAYVVPEAVRCVQCGICSYNCPLGIDVRLHAWNNMPVKQSECLTCSECIRRCPRGVLKFESSNIFHE
jgi:Fe-S oxidoreductase